MRLPWSVLFLPALISLCGPVPRSALATKLRLVK
jgi:hypothetical protein